MRSYSELRDALHRQLDEVVMAESQTVMAQAARNIVESMALLDAMAQAHEQPQPMPFGGPDGAHAAAWQESQEAGFSTDDGDRFARLVVDLLYPTVRRPAEG